MNPWNVSMTFHENPFQYTVNLQQLVIEFKFVNFFGHRRFLIYVDYTGEEPSRGLRSHFGMTVYSERSRTLRINWINRMRIKIYSESAFEKNSLSKNNYKKINNENITLLLSNGSKLRKIAWQILSWAIPFWSITNWTIKIASTPHGVL